MPTGYTAAVADGTVTDLKTFALRLARGMGAIVTMRDAPRDAIIPESIEPDGYYAERVASLTAKLAELEAMTVEQASAAAQADAEQFDADFVEARQRHLDKRDRYLAMIAKVEAWQGAPEGIKEFGLNQLTESLAFDCSEPFTFWRTRPATDGAEWLAKQKANVLYELEYATKNKVDEDARIAERNAWLAQLHRSLSGLDAAAAEEGQANG